MVKNKKNGIVLVMALLLLIGGAWGSYAWFTRSVELDSNLVIKVGTFDIKNVTPLGTKWELIDDGSEAEKDTKEEGKIYDFTNVRPGDSFKKTFTIENIGSLDQKLSIAAVGLEAFKGYLSKYGETIGVDNLGEVIVLKSLTGTEVTALQAGEKANFIITIEVSGEHANERLEGKSIDLETALNEITFVNVEATQTNAP